MHVFGRKCYVLEKNSKYVKKIDFKAFEQYFLDIFWKGLPTEYM